MAGTVKVAVHVDGKRIGYLKSAVTQDAVETLVTPSIARAEKFDMSNISQRANLVLHMHEFVGPERATAKAAEPVVTFRLIKL